MKNNTEKLTKFLQYQVFQKLDPLYDGLVPGVEPING